jgi:membrane associated rhomboid family serine protease
MFAAMDTGGLWRLREEPREVPLMSLAQALSDRRVVVVSLTWIGINLLAIVGVGNLNTDGGVAWQAHIGGFVAGFLLFGLFDPIARAKDYRAAARRDAE